jgi:3-dehydroquinate synthase
VRRHYRSNVAATHLDAPDAKALPRTVSKAVPLVLEPGEKTKWFDELMKVCDHVLGARLERGDVVLALGGGVIGDLSGFAAGIVRRGMSFIQVPTSLLAQVDSSVGGKTGINSSHGKNLIGVFHQPDLVLADTDVLDTLPIREFRAGYAEMAKYGLIDRPEFFAWLEPTGVRCSRAARPASKPLPPSCQAKADVVAADERESGCAGAAQSRPHLRPCAGGSHQYDGSGWSMAKAWRSGWCWRTSFRRG